MMEEKRKKGRKQERKGKRKEKRKEGSKAVDTLKKFIRIILIINCEG